MEKSPVVPGMPLGLASNAVSGPGTHLFDGQIYASVAGLYGPPNPSTGIKDFHKSLGSQPLPGGILSIGRIQPAATAAAAVTNNVLPAVDSTVLARITRINPRQATVAILIVDNAVCADSFQGLIRVQDIRATEKDKVKVVESFKPGDIVRAVVISLGDQSNYYLSTARNELGVVMAKSEAGNEMAPMSWKEMVDVKTGTKETRKVAKPVQAV